MRGHSIFEFIRNINRIHDCSISQLDVSNLNLVDIYICMRVSLIRVDLSINWNCSTLEFSTQTRHFVL